MSTINVNTLRTAAGASPVLVSEIAKLADVSAVRTDLAAPTGSGLVGYMPDGVGSAARTIESKLREEVSVTDQSGTDTAAFLAAANRGKSPVKIPKGNYSISSMTWPAGIDMQVCKGAVITVNGTLTLAGNTDVYGGGRFEQPIANVGVPVIIAGAECDISKVTVNGAVTTGNANFTNVGAIEIAGVNVSVTKAKIAGKQIGVYSYPAVYAGTKVLKNRITASNRAISLTPPTQPTYANKALSVVVKGNDCALQAGFDAAGTTGLGAGITVWGANGAIIEGNTSLGFPLSIESWWSTGSKIAKNTVDTWVSFDDCMFSSIGNNLVDYLLRPAIYVNHNASFGYGHGHGIEMVRSSYCDIKNNVVKNHPGNGIFTGYLGNSIVTLESHHLEIDGNTLSTCANAGLSWASLQLGGISRSTISRNKITDSSAAGGGYSILCGGLISGAVYSPVYDLKFIGNEISGDKKTSTTNAAVVIYYAKGIKWYDNIIKDCLCSGFGSGAGFTDGFDINRSEFVNNAGYGAYINFGNNTNNFSSKFSSYEGNGLGGVGAASGFASDNVMALHNTGFIISGIPTKGTMNVGDIINIANATNHWLRCTVAGTRNYITGATATGSLGTKSITVNAPAALYLNAGDYVTFAGSAAIFTVSKITLSFDANGISGAAVTLSANTDQALSATAISFSANTVVQVT